MVKKIIYHMVDLGIDNPSYFPGFTAMFTEFDYAVYGIGDTFNDALNDALDMLAQTHYKSELSRNTGDELDAIYQAEALCRHKNETTSAMKQERSGCYNEVTSDMYQDDCPVSMDEHCEHCHLLAIDEMVDKMDEHLQYYVGIRYSIKEVEDNVI